MSELANTAYLLFLTFSLGGVRDDVPECRCPALHILPTICFQFSSLSTRLTSESVQLQLEVSKSVHFNSNLLTPHL